MGERGLMQRVTGRRGRQKGKGMPKAPMTKNSIFGSQHMAGPRVTELSVMGEHVSLTKPASSSASAPFPSPPPPPPPPVPSSPSSPSTAHSYFISLPVSPPVPCFLPSLLLLHLRSPGSLFIQLLTVRTLHLKLVCKITPLISSLVLSSPSLYSLLFSSFPLFCL